MIPSDLVAHARGGEGSPARGPGAAAPVELADQSPVPGRIYDAREGGFVSSSRSLPAGRLYPRGRWSCLRPFAHVWQRGELRCSCGAATREPGEAEWDAASGEP